MANTEEKIIKILKAHIDRKVAQAIAEAEKRSEAYALLASTMPALAKLADKVGDTGVEKLEKQLDEATAKIERLKAELAIMEKAAEMPSQAATKKFISRATKVLDKNNAAAATKVIEIMAQRMAAA